MSLLQYRHDQERQQNKLPRVGMMGISHLYGSFLVHEHSCLNNTKLYPPPFVGTGSRITCYFVVVLPEVYSRFQGSYQWFLSREAQGVNTRVPGTADGHKPPLFELRMEQHADNSG